MDDTSLYDNSRIADTTTASALADLGITMAQPAVVTGMLFEEKMDNTMVGEVRKCFLVDSSKRLEEFRTETNSKGTDILI